VVSPVDRDFPGAPEHNQNIMHGEQDQSPAAAIASEDELCADHAMESYSMMLVLMSELSNTSALRDESRDLRIK
jgi:hypothetical protein